MDVTDRVSAVFDNRTSAERAITSLRERGVTDEHISIIAQHGEDAKVSGKGATAEKAGDAGKRAGKGAAAGAGVGALFGIAALAIPGVGPFIAAGWLAEALGVTAGVITAGAVVGGTSGALAGLFAKAGYDKEEARYYGDAVEKGGVFVAIDTRGIALTRDQARDVIHSHGGHVYASGGGPSSERHDYPRP